MIRDNVISLSKHLNLTRKNICQTEKSPMFDKKKYSSERKVTNVEKNYDEFLIAMAEKYKDHWVGCSPGDPGDGHPAPDHLATKILTIYQQHNDRHCLAFSLASALFHNGFVLQCLPRQRNSFTCFRLTEQYPVFWNSWKILCPK